MEGVGSEAASLAGHLASTTMALDLIVDNNHITIEGNTRIAFTEDVATPVFSAITGTCCGSATPTT